MIQTSEKFIQPKLILKSYNF